MNRFNSACYGADRFIRVGPAGDDAHSMAEPNDDLGTPAYPCTLCPVHAALCFIDAKWKLFAKLFQLRDAWVTWGQKLAEMIAADGPLSKVDVMNVADRLATALS
ncbi:MAG: hypothetical protein ABSA31_08330 [Acidimicrobiales bacterium]